MRKKNNLSISQFSHPYNQFTLNNLNTPINLSHNHLHNNTNLSTNSISTQINTLNSNKTQMRLLDELYNRQKITHKTGLQMQKLSDTIQSLAQSKNKTKNQYKQNTIDQETIPSNQTLPTLTNTTFRKDSSKLIDQIKRVQDKIKAMKNQRQEINQQKRQYQCIKPFVQLHNQSVMYMQMLMNNKQHHCCHNCPHNHQHSQPVNPPPPQYGYPYPMYPPPPYPIMQYANKPLKQSKNYKFNKLRKFRIAVIAVYFYLLLPKYANRLTVRRYKAHKNYITNENLLMLKKDIEKQLREKVIKWNMIEISQRVAKARADRETRRVKHGKTAKLIITQQHNGNNSYQIYLGDVEVFLFEFLKTMKQAVQYEDDLENILKYAARGSMPFSFPLDHFYLLDQLYNLNLHPQKLYLRNNRKTAKALLLSSIFVKLIAYNLFFPIKQNQQWKGRMLKVNNMKKQNMIQAQMAALQMHLSGMLLHRYSMQLIEQTMLQVNSNILDMPLDSWPMPQSALIFLGTGDVQSAFSAATSKKIKSRAQRLSLNKDPVNMQGYRQFNLYDFTYIKNLTDFEHLLQQTKKASKYEAYVKTLMVEIIDKIYDKLMGYRKQEYKHMKDELLIEQKGLMGVKVNYSSLTSTKRNGPQRKILKQAIQLVKFNKQRQEEGTQQQQQQQGQQQQTQQKSI